MVDALDSKSSIVRCGSSTLPPGTMKKGQKPKLIVVLGQTSTGKSDFAVSLAQKIGGEIISADSRQVYRGLDLLSGKITKKEMRGIPHHLLDIVSPRIPFSVAQFQKKAARAIIDISARPGREGGPKIPILVGGTGFYIDAVVNGTLLPEVKPNKDLRVRLEKLSAEKLFQTLLKLDPIRAKDIDSKNKVRLIRAIEIAKALGTVPVLAYSDSRYDVLFIGLVLPEEELRRHIGIRLQKRFKQGMLSEAQNLHNSGVSWKRMYGLGLESRYCALFLQKKISKQELFSQLELAIWQYAKRQKTWFKRNKEIIWTSPDTLEESIERARIFISKTNS